MRATYLHSEERPGLSPSNPTWTFRFTHSFAKHIKQQYNSSKLLGSHRVRDMLHQPEDAKANMNCCHDHMIMTNWLLPLCSEIIYCFISGKVGPSEMMLSSSNKCLSSLGRKDNVIYPTTVRSFWILHLIFFSVFRACDSTSDSAPGCCWLISTSPAKHVSGCNQNTWCKGILLRNAALLWSKQSTELPQ